MTCEMPISEALSFFRQFLAENTALDFCTVSSSPYEIEVTTSKTPPREVILDMADFIQKGVSYEACTLDEEHGSITVVGVPLGDTGFAFIWGETNQANEHSSALRFLSSLYAEDI